MRHRLLPLCLLLALGSATLSGCSSAHEDQAPANAETTAGPAAAATTATPAADSAVQQHLAD